MERNKCIDFFKGIACIAVVFIHYNFPGIMGLVFKSISRFAVPFFFFVSGFFLVNSSLEVSSLAIKKKIKHILTLILGSGLFYACFAYIWHKLAYKNWNVVVFISEKFNIDTVIRFLVTNDPFIYPHLWFLLALIYCYVTVLVFRTYITKYSHLVLYFAIILLVSFTCLSEFNNLLHIKSSIPLISKRLFIFNIFIFRALPFFLLGYVARLKQFYVKRELEKLCQEDCTIILFVIGSIMSICEGVYCKYSQFYIGNYIFLLGIYINITRRTFYKNRIINFIGEKMSLYVYILHIAVGKCFDLFGTRYNLWHNNFFLYTKSVIILIVTLLIAYFIVLYQEYHEIND